MNLLKPYSRLKQPDLLMMKKNLFIAFEGIDGCGKSTQAKLLAESLQKAGQKVHLTCEPTTGRIGQMIRDAFNNKMKADHRVIAGLFVADRLDHLLNENDGILKMLNDGYTVITDRYYFSSYAYQGTHMPLEWVIEANSLSAELLRPDLNIFIDIQPELSMKRLNKNRTSLELYETLENLNTVREKYLDAFEILKDKETITTVIGDAAVEEIAARILDLTLNYLKGHKINDNNSS
jgi:dTMP kinase